MSGYNPPTQSSSTRTSVTAIISLVTGLLGLVQILPFICPMIAIVTGHLAKSEIRRSGGQLTGDGLATTGLILGYLMLAIGLCAACVILLVLAGVFTLPFVIPFAPTPANF
jgi:ABC-type phosphate transport system permease subunit